MGEAEFKVRIGPVFQKWLLQQQDKTGLSKRALTEIVGLHFTTGQIDIELKSNNRRKRAIINKKGNVEDGIAKALFGI